MQPHRRDNLRCVKPYRKYVERNVQMSSSCTSIAPLPLQPLSTHSHIHYTFTATYHLQSGCSYIEKGGVKEVRRSRYHRTPTRSLRSRYTATRYLHGNTSLHLAQGSSLQGLDAVGFQPTDGRYSARPTSCSRYYRVIMHVGSTALTSALWLSKSELHKHETTGTVRVTLVYYKKCTPQHTEYLNVEHEYLYI